MLLVAVVAIIVVGPKDLPGMLRTFGKTVKKLRSMAGDFQRQFDDALKEAELDGVKNTVEQVRTLDPTRSLKDKLNPLKGDMLDVEQPKSHDFDPEELFDESKAPEPPEPVKVDVEASLKKANADQKPVKKSTKKASAKTASKSTASKTKAKSASAKTGTATKTTAKKPSNAKSKPEKSASKAKTKGAKA